MIGSSFGGARAMAWVVAMVLAGCGRDEVAADGAEDRLSTRRSAIVIDNGRQLNGRQLNGRQLNGRQLNGRQLNGRQLNGPELNLRRVSFSEVPAGSAGADLVLRLEGSELVGTAPDGQTLRGEALVGVVLTETDGTGPARQLRIDTFRSDDERPAVFLYRVSERSGGGWGPLCGMEADGSATEAIALSGTWDTSIGTATGGDHLPDEDTVTFACTGYVLSKCVELGYLPWMSGGRALHQGCTRALRADYCGDGRSFTNDGTLINIYDGVGIQMDAEPWALEAEWMADGARCVSATRRSSMKKVPQCGRSLEAPDCGDLQNFSDPSLLMTEFEPQ